MPGLGTGSAAGFQFLPESSGITYPSAPLSLTATPGDGKITLNWNVPATNGGSPITNNIVTYNGATIPTGSPSTSYVLTGVVDGTAYTISVAAVNSVGTGPQSNTVIATPTGGVVPMVTGAAFSNYVLAKNGDWEFAQMAAMTGAQFLAANPTWSVAPYFQFQESNNFDLTLLSIVAGKGLSLKANDPYGVGIWTNPYGSDYGVASGNFTVGPPFYREVSFIYQSVAGHNVNWGASWMLGLSPSGSSGYVENDAEIDMNEIDSGVMYTNIHSQNNTNVAVNISYGVTSSTPTTYRIGVYVTQTNVTVYWDGGNGGTPVISPGGGPMSWPGESLSSSTLFYLLHTNTSPGFAGDVVYDSSTVPNIVCYDRVFVPA
jgi:hypothetical protein